MKEVYRKFGRVVRRENTTLVRVHEAGEAWEDGDRFGCYPIDDARELPDVDADAVNATADAILALGGIERVLVSEGVTLHEFGGVAWSEHSRRVHAFILGGGRRTFIQLADFDVSLVARVATAMKKAQVRTIEHCRFADHIGAALLPFLADRISVQQWAAPHDGKGQWIENRRVDTSEDAPNWYRPTYRARPVRSWFHLRADDFGLFDDALPVAIAATDGGYVCVDGDEAFVTPANIDNVVAVRSTNAWYPYGAGCFGVEIVL